MVRLRLFAQAREAAGTGAADLDPAGLDPPTLGELLTTIRARFGPELSAVLDASRVWVNGEEPAAGLATPLVDGDEVAVLPPVSGG